MTVARVTPRRSIPRYVDNIAVIIPRMDAAQTLRDARRQAGLTQRALARRAHVQQPTVARIESRAVVPRVDTLDRLLGACGLSLATVPRPGAGVDRTQIRDLLALSPRDRLRLAARDGRNLDRLLARATRR
jgi:transcriptional regulator with XRE-family HTH domain